MNTSSQCDRDGRRSFLKQLGNALLACGLAPSLPAASAATAARSEPAAASLDDEEWNGLSDPGWSG